MGEKRGTRTTPPSGESPPLALHEVSEFGLTEVIT